MNKLNSELNKDGSINLTSDAFDHLPDPTAQHLFNLPDGYWIQTYMESHAYSSDKLKQFCDSGVRENLNVVGIIGHDTTGEISTPEKFHAFGAIPAKHGILAGSAFGLGKITTNSSAVGIGHHIATIANLGALSAFDMENDTQDEAIAMKMFDTYRATIRVGVVTVDQAWSEPIPRHHGSPMWHHLGKKVDFRCSQWYQNEPNLIKAYGVDRYWVMFPKYMNAWKWSNEHYPDCIRPVIPTIQGRGWSDIVSSAVHCFTTYATLIIWCEAFPSPTIMYAMRVAKMLRSKGFNGSNAVINFQKTLNLKMTNRWDQDTAIAAGMPYTQIQSA